MQEKIIVAGFGGQGVLSLGRLIAYAGMIEEKEVSWLPSYGAEMRGGTANCSVVVANHLIGSPVVLDNASCAIVMNKPSFTKFESKVAPGGKLIVNSSLIDVKSTRTDIEVHYVNANEIATECGTDKAANMVMLGAYLKLTGLVKEESVLNAFTKVFGEKKAKFIPMNKEALKRGAAVL